MDNTSSARRETAAATAEDKRVRQSESQTQTTTRAPEAAPRVGGGGVALHTEIGNTRIADGVVAKIAGLAARDIPGVFSMGSGMARRVGQLRSLIPGSTEAAGQGVSVEVGERE